MPPFYAAPEILTYVKYSVVVILIMNRPSKTVAKHPFSERGKRVDRVVDQELGGARGIALRGNARRVRRVGSPELIEFVFS